MKWVVSGKEMTTYDKNTSNVLGIAPEILMEQAATAFVRRFQALDFVDCKMRIVVLCGSGNNGGDGFAIARQLHLLQRNVVLLVPKEADAKSLCRKQHKICKELGISEISLAEITPQDLCIDGIFGTGLSRDVEEPFVSIFTRVQELGCKVVAIDIPSGISCENGMVLGQALPADATITFSFLKRGHILYPGRTLSGKVYVESIDITEKSFLEKTPTCILPEAEDFQHLPKRKPDGHKGTFGQVLVVGGSLNMAGAAYFSSLAAYRTGAGIVKILSDEENRSIYQSILPEAIFLPYKHGKLEEKTVIQAVQEADAIVLGPGLGRDDFAEKLFSCVFKSASVPLVIDADGLRILANHLEWLRIPHVDCILTPHMGEMSALTELPIGYLKENPISTVQDLSNDLNCIVVRKDACTVTGIPYEKLYLNQFGNEGMATAGSGDILSGVIAGHLAQGLSPKDAALFGVYQHSAAGDFAKKNQSSSSIMARDILECLKYLDC